MAAAEPAGHAPAAHVDPQLEGALIASLAADPGQYRAVRERLPADAGAVFATSRPVWERLANAIESQAPTAGLGGGAQPAPDPLAAAQQLAELYRRRVLARLAEGTLRQLDSAQPAAETFQHLETELAAFRDSLRQQPARSVIWSDGLLARVTQEMQHNLEAHAGQRTVGIPSGLGRLDRLLDGWLRGGLYILGGAPGVGKTSLALQWACTAALERAAVVVYVTYENSPQNLALKAIGRLAGVGPAVAERGRADPEKWQRGLQIFGSIAPRLALVPADAGTSIRFVEAQTRAALARWAGAECLVIVDYLQRIAYGERFGTLAENVSALGQQLRDLAARLDVPVMAISSLAPGRDSDAPLNLSALAERGDLEYASDVVLLLGRRVDVSLASAARVSSVPGLRTLDLLVAKNRYGEANVTLPLLFRPSTADFQEESTV
jgi:replicative DNA helicase